MVTHHESGIKDSRNLLSVHLEHYMRIEIRLWSSVGIGIGSLKPESYDIIYSRIGFQNNYSLSIYIQIERIKA